ncbi:MAG: porin [Prevotella sp.]|nr:porin [Prevotella sp.]
MKKILFAGLMLCAGLTASAQGNNTRMGGEDGDYQSIAERVAKLEKKNDMFNVYFNFAASAQAKENDGEWTSRIANKQLRLEIKGNLTDKLFYRLRHRLNKSNAAKGEDNFAKATDIMMVGYNFSDKVSLMGGKMCQIWGGFEFDENPMYIYEYSDMVENMDNFIGGVTLSLKPVPSQEIALEVSDANNGKLEEDYGANPTLLDGNRVKNLRQARNPLTYIVNWNGNFFGDVLQTRWSWGLQTQARGTYSRMLILGQRLNLPKLQWYVDYMGEFDDMDRLGIATSDLGDAYSMVNVYHPEATNVRFGKVHYNSFITKLNWQFAPQWNLMLKGTYETASVKNIEAFKDYRKSIGYLGSLEYYPDKSQDFRVFLAYVGHKYDFSKECGLKDYNTNRIELGFMYRIKCY